MTKCLLREGNNASDDDDDFTDEETGQRASCLKIGLLSYSYGRRSTQKQTWWRDTFFFFV